MGINKVGSLLTLDLKRVFNFILYINFGANRELFEGMFRLNTDKALYLNTYLRQYSTTEGERDSIMNSIIEAARLLKRAEHAIAFTGAGISAESGIPTFRGKGGLWEKYKPEEIATPEAFERDPVKVWEWYKMRMELIAKAKPNPGHIALARMEEEGIIKTVITQNVDGLHQRAGSKNVLELHGSIWRVRCTNPECNYRARIKEPPREIPPKCPKCGSLLRPDVVWFGEPLPSRVWEQAVLEASNADVVLVVGTSGVVMPAAMIPLLVKQHGGTIIEVNIEASNITVSADIFLKGKAGEILPRLAEELGIKI